MSFELKSRDAFGSPDSKLSYTRALFEEVAPRYDLATRLLSLGRDAAWKRHLIHALPSHDTPSCIDLACGTGDLTLLLSLRYPKGRIVGIDVSPAMMDIARSRLPDGRVDFHCRDMTATGLPDASADLITGGYALRNAPDLDGLLREVRRLLKPGGVAAFLDFSKPRALPGQWGSYALLKGWGSFWGVVLHGKPDAYGHIAESLRRYPDRVELQQRLTAMGFALTQPRRYFAGLVELLTIQKPA